MIFLAVIVVLREGEAVGHVLRMDFGAFVAVIVMVVIAVVVMVVVVMVVVVVVAVVVVAVVVVAMVIVTVIVVVGVSATHLQHDKIEGFDARSFEFEHVLAFFKLVDVNHRVRGASFGAVDAFLGRVMLVTLVMVVLLVFFFIVMWFSNHPVSYTHLTLPTSR